MGLFLLLPLYGQSSTMGSREGRVGLLPKESESTDSGQSAAEEPHKVARCSETAGTELLPASSAPPQTPKPPVMLHLQRATGQELAHTFAKLHPNHVSPQHEALSLATPKLQMDIPVLAEALKWPHSLISPKGTILLASLRLIYFNLTKTQAEGTSITLDNTATDSHHAVLFMVLVCFTEQTLKPYHPEHYVVPGVPQLNNTHLQTWTITIFFSSGADNFTGDLCTNAQPGSCGSANSLSSVTLLQSEDRSLQPEAASITHASSPASNTYDSSTICSIRIWTWSLQWSSLGKTEVTWMTTYLYDITKSLGSMHSKTSISLLREADS